MKRNHSDQLLEKWVEEANKKKKREVEKDHVSFQGPDTLLKRTQGGPPALTLFQGQRPRETAARFSLLALLGLSRTLYKQDCETSLCQERAGNKHTQVSFGVFFVVSVCFPDARAPLSSSRIAPACFTETVGPSQGKPGLPW